MKIVMTTIDHNGGGGNLDLRVNFWSQFGKWIKWLNNYYQIKEEKQKTKNIEWLIKTNPEWSTVSLEILLKHCILLQLTIGWFGQSRLGRFTEWSRSGLVDSRHTEMILLALDEMLNRQLGLGHSLCCCFAPSTDSVFFHLNDVAGDRSTAVRLRWRPGDSHLSLVGWFDDRFVWCCWYVWKWKNVVINLMIIMKSFVESWR